MEKRTLGYNFVEPTILKILKNSNTALPLLAINFHVNASIGREINLNIIKKNVLFLMDKNKISKKLDVNGVMNYKLVL